MSSGSGSSGIGGPTGSPGSIKITGSVADALGLDLADVQQLLASAMGYDMKDTVRVADVDGNEVLYIDRDGGVPTLSQPVFDFATAIAELSQLASMGLSGRLKMDMESAKTSFDERKAADKQRGESLRTAMKASEECMAAEGKSQKIAITRAAFALVGAVLLFALSVLLTPVTGGAAIAVGVAAVVGIAMAAGELATAVYAANGVKVENADGTLRNKDVTMGGMVVAITQKMISDGLEPMASMSKEEVADWQTHWTLALNLAVMVAMMACSGAGYGQMRSLAKKAKEGVEVAMEKMKNAHTGFQSGVHAAELVTQLSDASLTVVQGHLTRVQGDLTEVAALATATKDFLSALSTLAGEQAKVYADAFERTMKFLDSSMETTDTLLRLADQTARPSVMVG